ncbi:MAG: type I polyketide synthase, partial [Chthoniobacteraceae bacterium]
MDDDLDIAIIGLACRFPGAANAGEFWRNLAAGVESITRLSDDDILKSGAPKSHLTAPTYVKAAPVLDEPGAFDAPFFGFTPGEARTMDPQHRILLELAHEALEDAGCDTKRLPGRVGVFAGAAMNTYFMHAGLSRNFAEDYIPTLIFNDKDFLSTRISYKLDLKGPSLTVQTACSTSLVAVHLARQSLLSEESDIALAGAISVRAPHRVGYFSDPGGVSSPDGHVRAFDADANGTVFGSGGGIVVLKRLRDAIADGDTIRAIIKGSAINNDGAEKAGYTAPSVNSQADAVLEALANADVDADSISYIETHGSGTPVGDPIEVRALTKAFRASTQRSGFCAIGSVKTNVGHLDAAAGMAGLIKTVLALQHRQIPASLNFSRPNPEINFPATPFFVNTRLTPWPAADGPRRAGIMSTGMGGTNAHLILEEAPPIASAPESHRPNLFVLSARTESALAAAAEKLRGFLEANPSINLDAAAFTLQTGRRAMPHRRFVVAADRAAAIAALAAKPPRLSVSRADEGAKRPIVLLLPGVGDHYVGMGRELYTAFPA